MFGSLKTIIVQIVLPKIIIKSIYAMGFTNPKDEPDYRIIIIPYNVLWPKELGS